MLLRAEPALYKASIDFFHLRWLQSPPYSEFFVTLLGKRGSFFLRTVLWLFGKMRNRSIWKNEILVPEQRLGIRQKGEVAPFFGGSQAAEFLSPRLRASVLGFPLLERSLLFLVVFVVWPFSLMFSCFLPWS